MPCIGFVCNDVCVCVCSDLMGFSHYAPSYQITNTCGTLRYYHLSIQSMLAQNVGL